MPNLGGAGAAVPSGAEALTREGKLSVPQKIYLEGQVMSADGKGEPIGMHGILLPVAEMMQVWPATLRTTACNPTRHVPRPPTLRATP